MARTLEDYAFPAPPVCAGRWTAGAWLRFARRCGIVRRRGPAPSRPHPFRAGCHAPFCGFNDKGEALFDLGRAFQGVF